MKEDFWKKSCVIYYILDRTNGEGYVGQTKNKLKTRISHHIKYNNSYLGNAIKLHGWENFSVFVLEECESPDELNEREMYWIKTLHTKSPNGYNMTDGGDTPKGRVASDKERELRSERNPYKRPVRCLETGKIFPSVTAAAHHFNTDHTNISAVCQGRQITSAGHRFEYIDSPLSEEAKNRQPRKPHVRKVLCVERNEIFETIIEAAMTFGINASKITSVCQGKRKTTGSYHWQYVDEEKRVTAEIELRKKTRKEKPVRCVETNVVYSSIKTASEETGIIRGSISNVCRGKTKTAGGYHWRFVSED